MKYQSVPLVGGFYSDETREWSSQDCLNWIPAQAEQPGTRTPMILKTPPGLRQFVPNILFEITGHLADGYVGQSGTYQYAEDGGVPAYGDMTISSGALPTGASMNASGLVTFAYTAAGTFTWNVHGVDSVGNMADNPDSNVVRNESIINWRYVPLGGDQAPYCSACADSIALVVSANDTAAYSKDLGTTWTQVGTGLASYTGFSAIKFNGYWIILSNHDGTGSYCAGDTFAFTPLADAPSVNYPSLTILNGHLYSGYGDASFNQTVLLKLATLGSSWAATNTGFTHGEITSMCDTGSKYFFACHDGQVISTTDFGTFTLSLDTGGANRLVSVAYLALGNVLIVSDLIGNTWRSTDLGTTWTSLPAAGIAAICTTHSIMIGGQAGSGNTVYTSPDGITWTSQLYSATGQNQFCPSTDGTVAVLPSQAPFFNYAFVGVP